jgi:hypothetical protein
MIMENISHGSLERRTCILESKRHDTVGKSTPWGGKCSFILICWMDLDFIVARETIHEGQSLMACTVIDNLVDERCGEVVFGTSMVEIMKFSADANSALFFVNGDRVGYHDMYVMGYMNPTTCSLLISALIATALDGCSGHCF